MWRAPGKEEEQPLLCGESLVLTGTSEPGVRKAGKQAGRRTGGVGTQSWSPGRTKEVIKVRGGRAETQIRKTTPFQDLGNQGAGTSTAVLGGTSRVPSTLTMLVMSVMVQVGLHRSRFSPELGTHRSNKERARSDIQGDPWPSALVGFISKPPLLRDAVLCDQRGHFSSHLESRSMASSHVI